MSMSGSNAWTVRPARIRFGGRHEYGHGETGSWSRMCGGDVPVDRGHAFARPGKPAMAHRRGSANVDGQLGVSPFIRITALDFS